MQRRKKIIIGNWKMSPSTVNEAKDIFSAVKKTAQKLNKLEVVICPSSVHLGYLFKKTGRVRLGIQDVFQDEQGYFTGQISAKQARDAGARYCLVGHSERREQGDGDSIVASKLSQARKAGMTAVLCIGERERDADGNFYSFLRDQILSGFSKTDRSFIQKSMIIAYEPVWAIGKPSSEAMKPADIHQTSIFIRKIINDVFGPSLAKSMPVLYGGSVTTENASQIVTEGGVDGLLIGRQSLEPKGFSQLLKNIEKGNANR